MVLPVTYGMYNGDVVFRTSPYGALSALADRTNVAFEIDEVDQDAGTGWSVLVRGWAQAVVGSYDLVTLWQMDGVVPWATGTRNLFISITPHAITGRAVKAPFAD
jgi:nitroimidazol reductase NimA-like FMN-containing flavoprotein (pyridoxamine 5'-phosphate oxidase superfamily)